MPRPLPLYINGRVFSCGAGCGTDVIQRKDGHHGRSSSQHGHRLRSGVNDAKRFLRRILTRGLPTRRRVQFLLQIALVGLGRYCTTSKGMSSVVHRHEYGLCFSFSLKTAVGFSFFGVEPKKSETEPKISRSVFGETSQIVSISKGPVSLC